MFEFTTLRLFKERHLIMRNFDEFLKALILIATLKSSEEKSNTEALAEKVQIDL